LWTENTNQEKIKVIACWNDKEEARFVVSEIEKFITTSKYKAGNIAVLVRAGFQTRAFEEVFIANALPYKIIGGLRFYERMEIRDILAYIRITLNNNDNLALERIINTPKRSIGNITLKNIKDYAAEHNLPALFAIKQMIEEGALKSRTAEILGDLLDKISNWQQRYITESAFEVTKAILEQSGYLEMLKQEKTEESRGRIENINEMLRAIDEFNNIEEFVQHSSLVMENELLESNFGGAVNIMTLHGAKGLEFDVVFLPGWEEGIFPHQKAIQEEGEKGLEEERRIAYVGITRAKQVLYISYAENRWMYHEVVHSIPSRFLAEIPNDVCLRTSSTKNVNYHSSKHNFAFQPAPTPTILPKSNTIRAGSTVKHAKFGTGIVIRLSEDNLEIAFQEFGIKTIKRDFIEL
jgi:DNA helicase-2/ATP-dependent DNA helicase PcrA